jgi:hypothetical protein
MANRARFYEVISAAIADLSEHGFDSQERVERWMRELRAAAVECLVPASVLERNLRDVLERTYSRTLATGRLAKVQPGVSNFTVQMLTPKLRAELDRRILASANLIKLNREASIQRTLQRFSGWATSIPAGGSDVVKRGEEAQKVRRSIAGLPFEERRVVIDQGGKLASSLNDIIAVDGGAIVGTWRHIHPSAGYQSRPEHLAMDGEIFVIRDNWALRKDLIKLAGHKYTDQVDAPGGPVFCSCYYEYGYSLRDLPAEMITAKGKEALLEARKHLRSPAYAA